MHTITHAIKGGLSYGVLTNLKVIFQFAGFLILARLLEPAIFGQVTLAASIAALIFIVTTWGDIELIVQESSTQKARSYGGTAVWTKLAITIAVMVVLLILRPWLTTFYPPQVITFLFVLAAAQGIGVIGGPFKGFLQRELKMTHIGALEAGGALLASTLGIFTAMQGFGGWGLAVYYVTPLLITGVGFILFTPLWPIFTLKKQYFKKLFSFGGNVLGARATDRIRDHGDDFFIGTLAGSTALGFYTLAYRLSRVFHQVAVSALVPTILPTFSKLRADPKQLKKTFAFTMRNVLRGAVPFYFILGIFAPSIITLIFGSQWLEAANIFRIIIPFGLFFPVFSLAAQLRYAQGRPNSVFRAQGVALIAFLITMPLFVWQLGLTGAGISLDITVITAALLLVVPLSKELNIHWGHLLLKTASPKSGWQDIRFVYRKFRN